MLVSSIFGVRDGAVLLSEAVLPQVTLHFAPGYPTLCPRLPYILLYILDDIQ